MMAAYHITQVSDLRGEVQVNAAKNAVLPILAASLLTKEPITVCQVPQLTDVNTLGNILRACGVFIQKENHCWILCAQNPQSPKDEEDMRKMRASVLIMGPLLARTGYARITFPGGCAIGQRPIDLHLKGMQALGAQISQTPGSVTLTGELRGGNVYLDIPSVGATENILMAASLAKGLTRIENAAKEPEVVDLANCMVAMGAKIHGAGTSTIWVEGVTQLHSARYAPIPDRIEAGTLLCAAAITRGSVLLRHARPEHMRAVIFKLMEAGVQLRETKAGLRASGQACHPVEVRTLTYPGFPTDMQAPMMVVSLSAPGVSLFLETIFENRYMHAQELRRMGAHIRVEGQVAILDGGNRLQGTTVTSTDLRAGAALMLAGLCAQGETTLLDPAGHIERGYEGLPEKLNALGANIQVLQ